MRRLHTAALATTCAALVTGLTGQPVGAAEPITSPAATAATHGSYIVTLRDNAVVETASALLTSLVGGQRLFVYDTVATGFSLRMPASAADLLRLTPGVVSVRPDLPVESRASQTGATWGLDRIDQRGMRLDGRYTSPRHGGKGAHIYVVDTGLNAAHSEFAGRVGRGANFVSGGLLGLGGTDIDAWGDCEGHGTHVASTAAGSTYGVAKKATVHAVRVLDCGGVGSESGILAGLDWIAKNQQTPAVANLSFGTSQRSAGLESAVRRLVEAGVAVSVAAGNEAKDACTSSPAAEPQALTVGATARGDARARFSNVGPCVDLFAPGVDITAADHRRTNGATQLSGTSMAAPHVAGALALVRTSRPGLSAAAAHRAVVGSATEGKVGSAGAGSPNLLLYVDREATTASRRGPQARFTASCQALRCTFDASRSTGTHRLARYVWRFGDGEKARSKRVTHRYSTPGKRTVRLVVVDVRGKRDSDSRVVRPARRR